MNEVTQILAKIEGGDPSAAEHLLPLVYEELRKLATVRLAPEKPSQTLQATGQVHTVPEVIRNRYTGSSCGRNTRTAI